MEREVLLVRLKTRLGLTGTGKDALLSELLSDAADAACGYLGRPSLPDACESAVLRLAAVQYNRLGMEGEASHAEGGVSVSSDGLPADIKAMLRPYRTARTV